MLANIDLRLTDIFVSSECFRNIFILLHGDIRQLPTIFDTPLYAQGGRDFQLTGSFSYYVFEECDRLGTVFRKHEVEESIFRDALLPLSDGRSTIRDWKLFNTRDYMMLTIEGKNNFKHAFFLFPTKFGITGYNHHRLKEIKLCCCQEERKNMSTQCSLVNGSTGTVVDVMYSNGEKSPVNIPVVFMVEFKKYTGRQLYEGSNVHYKLDIIFGGNMSTNSVTVHFMLVNHDAHCQGLTLDQKVVDIGSRENLGLTLVALSKTRRLLDVVFSSMFSFDRITKIGE
ncbi:hypothetical protein MKX01_026516 [Papaver californicum]|nr:hypothetical protein MKX01_026516 [Papaver californicum]